MIDGAAFERVTAWEWLRRAVGQRAFERVWGAQLRAKFGPRAEQVSMVWFWNKIFLRTQSRPGLLAREQLGYIMGSFNVLIERLADACRELGVDIRAGVGVNALERHEGIPRFTVCWRRRSRRAGRHRVGHDSFAGPAAPRARSSRNHIAGS